MTPEQYLAGLQQEYKAQNLLLILADYMSTTITGVSIFGTPELRELLKRHDLSPNSPRTAIIDMLAKEEALIAERRHESIVSCLLPDQVDLLLSKGPLAVGTLEFAQFSASAIPVPDGRGAVLAFRRGLDHLIYTGAKLLLAMSECKALGISPTLDCDSGGSHFIEMLRYQSRLGLDYHSPLNIEEAARFGAQLIIDSSVVFVHCHELAHVLLGHVECGESHALATTDGTVTERVSSLQEEFDADRLGLELAISSRHKNMDSSVSMAFLWAGVWMFLQMAAIIEELEPSKSDTHPPAGQRLKLLEGLAKTACLELGLDGRCIYRFAGPMSRSLMSAIGRRELREVLWAPSPLEQLLDTILSENEGLLAFQGQLFMWIATTALPRRFCNEVGRIRAHAIRTANVISLDLRQMSGEEIAKAADTTDRRDIRSALAKWLALDLKTSFDQFHFSNPLFEDYVSRIERATDRQVEYLTGG
jgi:hypothetical protein